MLVVEINETPEPLTIEQLSAEIARLRRLVDEFRQSEKPLKENQAKLNQEEKKILEDAQRALDDVRSRRRAVTDSIQNLAIKVDGFIGTIEEYQKLMAELVAKQAESDRLAKMAQDLAALFESNLAWSSQNELGLSVAGFQKEFVAQAVQAYRNGLNGFACFDDMGAGKTLQAMYTLAALQVEFFNEHGRYPRIAWFTKKNLIKSTIIETMMWLPGSLLFPLEGSMPAEQRDFTFNLIAQMNAIMITNYETVNTMPQMRSTTFDFVVIDECHKLKGGANATPTKIWKNTKDICRKSRFILLLSGTPMVNKVEEMWSYLHIFDPERFPSLRKFESMMQVFDVIKGDWVISADKLLKDALVGQCLRRTKEEFGIQLPELLFPPRVLTMTDYQNEVYQMMRKNFFVWLDKQGDKALSATAIIAQLTRLRQISVWPAGIETKVFEGDTPETQVLIKRCLECFESSKIDEALEIIEELHDADEQVVLFSTFNAPLFEVQRRCHELGISCEVIYGGQTRTDLQQEFQAKKLDVLAINLAMGEGMNLQKNKEVWPGGASTCILLDKWWTPARNDQAISRIHRIGAHEACTVYALHNEDTVDGFIQAKLDEKSRAFANVLERDELRGSKEWREMLDGLI